MSPTQLTGMAGFACAALACATRRGPGWAALALFFALAAVELHYDGRWRLHNWAKALVIPAAGPPGQHAVQLALLALAATLYPLLLWRGARGPHGLATARLAAILLLGVTAVETISLHQTDAVLFAPAGPVIRIAWIWVALSLLAAWGALSGRRGRAGNPGSASRRATRRR